ncbi:Glucan endo-1,3-beta-glucosidase 1 [Senna tora]|uniref:Glucan endo-1,3-beta-glucosidase 1 n=1 Tax=Senna tora TaxID=362788 RepID=A0A834W597_9FABA|nr:Glucan endo-1,3-beta-glucosidase 1 [Senna tora]
MKGVEVKEATANGGVMEGFHGEEEERGRGGDSGEDLVADEDSADEGGGVEGDGIATDPRGFKKHKNGVQLTSSTIFEALQYEIVEGRQKKTKGCSCGLTGDESLSTSDNNGGRQ